MSDTDILLTLYSIVAGLGISKLAQGFAAMIKSRERIQRYWVHSTWLVIVLIAHVVTIFALMRFSNHTHWTVFSAMLALSMPLLLYLISDLIVPEIPEQGKIDMRAYFYVYRKWFYGLLIALSVIAMVVQVVVERDIDRTLSGVLRMLALLTLAGGLVSARPAVQAVIVLVLLAVMTTGAMLISVRLM
jgi:hypothetical protein